MAVHPKVAHRKGIATAVAELYPKSHLFQAIGGRAVVGKLIDAFYDQLLADPHLRPKFAADPSMERIKQKAFFEEWLGGEELYTKHYASRGLQQIHHEIYVSKQDAARWLGHFEDAMEAVGIAAPKQKEILKTLRPLAFAIVNRDCEAENDEHRSHRCLGANTFFEEGRAAERGDVGVVAAAIKKHRRLLDEPRVRMQTLLFIAVGRGKTEVVKALLKGGADPNVPSQTGLHAYCDALLTPLCLAKIKRKQTMIDLLIANGALDDVFTMAALGEVEKLRVELKNDRTLANVNDPATDTFPMTPLYHAVNHGQTEAARLLLKYGAKVGPLSSRLARMAAEQQNTELLRLLLNHGADATRIGAGRWVIHPEISTLLDKHGADVNYAMDKWHSWIWRTCTGNNRNTDQPEVVAGIVARGVEINSTKLWGRGALHFAAKAGFIGTVNVLLKNGADPNLRDNEGQTPLFYAFRAGKSVNPKPVVAALLKEGADPDARNNEGKTIFDLFPKARTIIKLTAARLPRR